MSTSASAYYVDGGVVKDGSGAVSGSYFGYIGDVNVGLPSIGNTTVTPTWIGTHYVSDGAGSYVENYPVVTGVADWYLFSASAAGPIAIFAELGTSISAFTISFFVLDESDNYLYSRTATAAEINIRSFVDAAFNNPITGDILMKIEGIAQGSNPSYRVRLIGTPVPVPPAALLFVSALAGFGVIGRRKRGKA